MKCLELNVPWSTNKWGDVVKPVCTGCKERGWGGLMQNKHLLAECNRETTIWARAVERTSWEPHWKLKQALLAGQSPHSALRALQCPHTRQRCCQAPANVVNWALSQSRAGPPCLAKRTSLVFFFCFVLFCGFDRVSLQGSHWPGTLHNLLTMNQPGARGYWYLWSWRVGTLPFPCW